MNDQNNEEKSVVFLLDEVLKLTTNFDGSIKGSSTKIESIENNIKIHKLIEIIKNKLIGMENNSKKYKIFEFDKIFNLDYLEDYYEDYESYRTDVKEKYNLFIQQYDKNNICECCGINKVSIRDIRSTHNTEDFYVCVNCFNLNDYSFFELYHAVKNTENHRDIIESIIDGHWAEWIILNNVGGD